MVTGSGTDNSKPLAVTTVTSAIQAQINQRSIKNFDDGNATQNNENRQVFVYWDKKSVFIWKIASKLLVIYGQHLARF